VKGSVVLRAAAQVASGLWVLLLLAPSVAIFAASNAWDVSPLAQLSWSLCAFAALWITLGRRWFVAITFPLALFGALAVGADLLRNVNLLELLLVSGGASAHEISRSLRPYVGHVVALASLLAASALLITRTPVGQASVAIPRSYLAAAIGACVIGLLAASPQSAVRAWPMNLLASGYAKAFGRDDLLATMLPYAALDPRDKSSSWDARRARPDAPRHETYVLVIGESVRADRLRECGGPRPVAPQALSGLLVYCDVMAGSSSTHTSVPLLLSRDKTGGPARVSSDATVLKAFAESGFRTYWLSVQEPAIAWPDAHETRYLTGGSDRAVLLPALRRALDDPHEKKLVVLHAYNAHFRYCDRYGPSAAVAPVDCKALGHAPARETREPWLASYDNAVQESMLFLDDIHAMLQGRPGEVFLAYSPDHGENLLDDERGLFQHALSTPTRWDTRVPLLLWANAAWRTARHSEWSQLAENRGRPLMHADLVPTLLGAAGITYTDKREQVTDLTRTTPQPRVRWVLRRLGEAVDGDKL
jgi:glucan phosphoethanolaminetransferase (alkaline phosphatase superfamily)